LHFDLDGLLYLGGVAEEMYSHLPSLIQNRYGLESYMASLKVNGETINPTGKDALNSVLILATLVSDGCSGYETNSAGIRVDLMI